MGAGEGGGPADGDDRLLAGLPPRRSLEVTGWRRAPVRRDVPLGRVAGIQVGANWTVPHQRRRRRTTGRHGRVRARRRAGRRRDDTRSSGGTGLVHRPGFHRTRRRTVARTLSPSWTGPAPSSASWSPARSPGFLPPEGRNCAWTGWRSRSRPLPGSTHRPGRAAAGPPPAGRRGPCGRAGGWPDCRHGDHQRSPPSRAVARSGRRARGRISLRRPRWAASLARSWPRPRCRDDFTVPTGMPVRLALCRQLRPFTSAR